MQTSLSVYIIVVKKAKKDFFCSLRFVYKTCGREGSCQQISGNTAGSFRQKM